MPIPTWLSNFIGFGWIRDLLGIRKDLIDTKKSKLEVKKLEHEERERSSLITLATFDDVKKYNPKYKAIKRRTRDGMAVGSRTKSQIIWRYIIYIVFCLIATVGAVVLLFWWLR